MFKEKEEVIVTAILAIIASALISGYGTYYFLNLRPIKIKSEKVPHITKNITDHSSNKQTAPMEIKDGNQNSLKNEFQSAQTVLENFFTYLANKQYQKAAALYAWGDDDDPGNNLQTWPGADNAETFENYCRSMDTCLRVKVLSGAKIDDNEYTFIVQFLTDEGKIYKHPSVVGVKPSTNFNFKVKKINNQFKVVSPPLYHS